MILANQKNNKVQYAQYDWQAIDVNFIQGGNKGVVIGKQRTYTTAFIEVYGVEIGLLRGEGETVEIAEDNAWIKAIKVKNCSGHKPEPRKFKNGDGICGECDKIMRNVFTPDMLDMFCHVCGLASFLEDPYGVACREHHVASHILEKMDKAAEDAHDDYLYEYVKLEKEYDDCIKQVESGMTAKQ